MKKVSKRILALLMTAIMLTSYIQISVFAADATVVSLEVAVKDKVGVEGIDLSDRDNSDYEFLVYGVYDNGEAMTGETFTYDIIDVKTGDIVAENVTVAHNETLMLQGGQRAEFSNMEAGTSYTFTEIQGATQFFIPTAKFNGENVNLSFAYSVHTGVIADGQTYDVDFINILTPTTVTLKYYDRVVEEGQPTDIGSTPKSVSYDYYGSEVEYKDGKISNYAKLIEEVPQIMGKLVKPDNILDSYKLFTNAEDAANEVKKLVNYHTGENYIYTEYHTNQYGYTQSEISPGVFRFEDGTTGDGKKWVEIDEDSRTIDTWLFNSPKKYTVKTYGVTSTEMASKLGLIGNGKYVNSSVTSAKNTTAFYNQRMGAKPATESSDDTTAYLTKYGLDGYTGVTATTDLTATTEDGTTVNFLYWAFDDAGTNIASTDATYNYRITSDTELYAIYGTSTTTAPGVSLRENGYDLYFDNNGVSRIRLNSVLNPYGTMAEANITDVAILYVDMTGVEDVATEVDARKNDLIALLNDDYAISGTITMSNGVENKVNGFSYDVVAKADADTIQEVYLSSKNRVQFSTTFKKAQFDNLKLIAVAAVCIDGTWTITTNYNDYNPATYL